MHGFEWKDQRGVEGIGFVRALRSLLTSHLPTLLPDLETAISTQFDLSLRNSNCARGQFVTFPCAKLRSDLSALQNIRCVPCLLYFRKQLLEPIVWRSSDQDSVSNYIPHLTIIAEVSISK